MREPKAILYALLAAAFYAVNMPCSKLLLQQAGAATMAALLYLGAGLGIGILSLLDRRQPRARLDKKDLPFVTGMIVLDIAAPLFLMLGIRYGSAAGASLLGNFEIVATAVIALAIFKEAVSRRLWAAIGLITLASLLLSFEGAGSLRFSRGSLLVLLATVCWGLENNCTRRISSKDTYQIVFLKGIFSGLGSLGIAFLAREAAPSPVTIALALLLGFVAYGLSIFLYVRAEHARRGQDKRLLRRGAVHRGVPFLFAAARAPDRALSARAGRDGRRHGARDRGYAETMIYKKQPLCPRCIAAAFCIGFTAPPAARSPVFPSR